MGFMNLRNENDNCRLTTTTRTMELMTRRRSSPSIQIGHSVTFWFGILLALICLPGISSIQQQSFRRTPVDTKARLGDSVLLPCEIDNQGGQAQWTKDGFALGYEKIIPGFDGRYSMSGDVEHGVHNLVIVNVTLQDIAEFQCQVRPFSGTKAIRSNALLDVEVPPKSIHMTNYSPDATLTLKVNQEIELECIVTDSRPAPTIFWYRKNALINSGVPTNEIITEHTNGLFTKSSKVRFMSTPEYDSSMVTCEARHSALTRPMRVDVYYRILFPPGAPKIEGYKEGDLLRENQYVTLICISHGGNPLAELTWYKNGELIDSVDKTHVGSKVSMRELTFYTSLNDNLANFRCEATNSMTPTAKIAEVQVTVMFPPKHVEISGVKEAKIGDSVTLSCKTSISNPKTTISWFKDGKRLDDYTSSNEFVLGGWITTSNITVKMERKESFSCEADAKELGLITSRGIVISVLEPPGQPIIDTEVLNITAGQRHLLTCTSTGGHPPAMLTWYKDDHRVNSSYSLEGSTAKAELFLTVNASDNRAPYRCEAINKALSSPLSAVINFSVIFPPSGVIIRVQPTQLREGQKARLICESGSSNPPSEVSLYKNSQLVSLHLNQSIKPGNYGGSETSIDLELDLTSEFHGVNYTCEARNSVGIGQTENATTLDVNYKPQIEVQRTKTGVEGESAIISLVVKANPSLVVYKWRRNGEELNTTPNVIVDGPILMFTPLSRTDMGFYEIEAANAEGSTLLSVELDVKYPPSILETTAVVVAGLNADSRIDCTIDANPLDESMVRWKYRNGNVNSASHKMYFEGQKSYLTIENVTTENTGEYFCIVDNGIGSPANSSVFLLVNHKPRIDTSPGLAKSARNVGETGALICRATGTPLVKFYWSRNEVALTVDSNPFKYTIHNRSSNPMTFESTLQIYSVDPSDYGEYKCTAQNEHGTSEHYINFVKPTTPDTPTNLRVENTTESTVTLTWIAGFDGGHDQSFEIQYFQIRSDKKNSIATNMTTLTVDSLASGTQYYFKVKACNSIGESNYTKELIQGTLVVRSVTSTMDYHANFSRLIVTTFIIVGSVVLIINLILIGCFVKHRTKKREGNQLNTKSAPVEMYATSSYNGTGESSLSEKSYCGDNEFIEDKSLGASTYFVEPISGDRNASITLPAHHNEDDSLRRSGYRGDNDNERSIANPPLYGSTFRPSHPDICATNYYPSPCNSNTALNGNMHTPNPNPIDQSFLNWRINATLSPSLSTFVSPNIENEGHLV